VSLQEARSNGRSQSYAYGSDTEPESDEEEFQRQISQALEASKLDSAKASTSATKESTPASIPDASEPAHSGPLNNFLRERAQLEKERLQRQKRLLKDTSFEVIPTDDDDDEVAVVEPKAKRPHRSDESNSISVASGSGSGTKTATTSTSNSTHGPFFWDGEYRPTANMHSQPRKDGKLTFRISEIIGEVRGLSSFILFLYFCLD
jgi:tyrosyl-DNA phosphodiesterase 1